MLRCSRTLLLWRGLLGRLRWRYAASRLILVGTVLVRLILIGLIADRLSRMCRLSWILMSLRGIALLRLGLVVSLHGRGGLNVVICHEWLADGQTGRTAMIYAGKLSTIGAGNLLILELRPHWCGMSLVACREFRGSGSHLKSTRSAIEAHTSAPAVFADGAIVDVVHDGNVNIVD